MLKKLKKKYDKLKIEEIESYIITKQESSATTYKNMICGLYYIDCTNRHFENKKYKDVPFKIYIKDRFNILYGNYRSAKTAYAMHPDITDKYGVGLVDAVGRECGTDKIPAVFKKIDSINGIDRDGISAIIDKFRKPKFRKPKNETIKPVAKNEDYWKKEYLSLEQKYKRLQEDYKDLLADYKLVKEQLDKLKKTASAGRYKSNPTEMGHVLNVGAQ